MLGIVKEIDGQKTIIPLTTDTGTGAPVGTLISQYKKVPMSGYLYCDGSTFDENAYPALYMYLGTNVLPDYRECVMVGAEQNTTDTNTTHGKQKAVYVYIKATSGLAENQQDNVLKDVKDYIRRSNELSPIEDCQVYATNQTAQYDGFLFLQLGGNNSKTTTIYINDERLVVGRVAGQDEDTLVLPICKGDTFRADNPDTIWRSKARWYKNR